MTPEEVKTLKTAFAEMSPDERMSWIWILFDSVRFETGEANFDIMVRIFSWRQTPN